MKITWECIFLVALLVVFPIGVVILFGDFVFSIVNIYYPYKEFIKTFGLMLILLGVSVAMTFLGEHKQKFPSEKYCKYCGKKLGDD